MNAAPTNVRGSLKERKLLIQQANRVGARRVEVRPHHAPSPPGRVSAPGAFRRVYASGPRSQRQELIRSSSVPTKWMRWPPAQSAAERLDRQVSEPRPLSPGERAQGEGELPNNISLRERPPRRDLLTTNAFLTAFSWLMLWDACNPGANAVSASAILQKFCHAPPAVRGAIVHSKNEAP